MRPAAAIVMLRMIWMHLHAINVVSWSQWQSRHSTCVQCTPAFVVVPSRVSAEALKKSREETFAAKAEFDEYKVCGTCKSWFKHIIYCNYRYYIILQKVTAQFIAMRCNEYEGHLRTWRIWNFCFGVHLNCASKLLQGPAADSSPGRWLFTCSICLARSSETDPAYFIQHI